MSQTYKLIEHRIGDGGSVTEGKGYGVLPNPIQIIPFEQEIPPAYRDISTIYYWDNFGRDLEYDYIFVHDRIKELIAQKAIDNCLGEISDPSTVTPNVGDKYCVGVGAIGDFENKEDTIAEWNGSEWDFYHKDILGYTYCNLQEKEIAARLYIGNPDVHRTDFGIAAQNTWQAQYHADSTETRLKRILFAESLVQQELPTEKNIVMLLITSLVTQLNINGVNMMFSIDMHKNYKSFGVRGSVYDYHPITNPQPADGLLDYFESTGSFTGNGLVDMPWVGVSMTMQEIANKIKEIIILGVY